MTAAGLRNWRGVKLVAVPAGTAITTRLRVTDADEAVLNATAEYLGQLRCADLATVSRTEPTVPGLDVARQHQAHRDRQNARKRNLTALSSAPWANAIIVANDAQFRSSQDAQDRHIAGLCAALAAIERRLAQPTADTLTRQERATRKKARLPRGYPTQAERFQKQRRLQSVRAELCRVTADRDARRVHMAEGGKPVSYAITRKPGRAGVYLTAAWATKPETSSATPEEQTAEVHAAGQVVGVDLNDGHLAVRRLDPHGNPVGKPERIEYGPRPARQAVPQNRRRNPHRRLP